MRYISPARIIWNANGKAAGIYPEAFKRRPAENGLSVTWLGYFSESHDDSIVTAIHSTRSNTKLSVKPKSGFAIGNVGDILSSCESYGSRNDRVVYLPSNNNNAHAEVKLLPRDDQLLDLLATETWANLILNKDVPC